MKTLLAIALTWFALAEGQYGPLKGPSTHRTTTPFPPGFQSDSQIYNSISNSIASDSNQIPHGYPAGSSGGGCGGAGASGGGCGGSGPAPGSSGYGVLSGANQKTPAGAASYSDNPWLSGIVAQNSGPGPVSSSGPSYQQTRPSVPCNAPGHVCVQKHQCQGGQTSSPGSGSRQCDANTEVCCQHGQGPQQPSQTYLPSSPQPSPGYGPRPHPQPQPSPGYGPRPHPQPQPGAPTFQPGQAAHRPQPGQPGPQQGPSYQPGSQQGPSYQPGPQQGPSYQPGPQQGPSYQPGSQSGPNYQQGHAPSQHGQSAHRPQSGPSYQPGQPSSFQPGQRPHQSGPAYQPGQGSQGYNPGAQGPQPQPGYRPGTNGVPIGGSIYDQGSYRPGSSHVTPAPIGPYTGPLNTTPHPGCPAALKCVEEIYCDAMGVMRDQPVQLTREELENKVPLSECQNIETGIIGKCCRDPNYKDPWPDMNNGDFDDGHYHGDHGAHGGHGNHGGHDGHGGHGNHGGHDGHGAHGAQPGQQFRPQNQFNQQGTSSDSTCGPSATCTPQSQCSGDRHVQPGKQCTVPHDGSTGVCCSKPPFPSFSNNQQVATTPITPAHRPTPGQQYYTPKPPVSNNPFLPENQGRFPTPQQPVQQGPIHPTGISPVNYRPTQPNAIPGQNKDYDYGKDSTPKPTRPSYAPQPTHGASSTFPQPSFPQSPAAGQRPNVPQPNYPQPSNYPRPSSTPGYQQPSSTPSYQQPSYSPSTTAQTGYPRPTGQATPTQSSHPRPTGQSSPGQPGYQQPSYTPSHPAQPGYPRPTGQATPAQSGYQQPTHPSYTPSQPSYPRPTGQSTPNQPGYQQPTFPSSTPSQPAYPRPGGQSTPAQPPLPGVANLPVFPQIATANSVYTPRPGFSQSTPQSTTPSYQQQPSTLPSQYYPGVTHQGALPGSNTQVTLSTTLAPPVESNEITPAPGHQQTVAPEIPTRGRGPSAGYPFLAPTTESNNRRPVTSSVQPGKECGVRRETQRPNGPNGIETGFGEFPWQALVLASSSQTPLCSGAILSAKVIVTAAHCVDDFTSGDVAVKAGKWKLGNDTPDQPKPSQVKQVAAISRHPKYDPVSRFYDMAVLILSEPLQLDQHVDILCLGDNTPEGQRPAGNNCVVTGWGKANLQSNTPGSTMHSIPVNFIESAQCEDTFRKTNLGKYFQLNKSFVCAVPISPSDDLCQVDVGSPIACQKPDGHYQLSGIYSWDVGCHQPVAASNVDKPWVQSVMNKPVEQVKQEEQAEQAKKENLGFNPNNSDLTKPGFSQGYGKK